MARAKTGLDNARKNGKTLGRPKLSNSKKKGYQIVPVKSAFNKRNC